MNLRQIRKDCGLTQQDVATATGISRASYTNIENGERRPSVELAKKIAALLHFDWTTFFLNE